MEPVKFGPFLREERTARQLTQTQLAELLHVTPAAVSKWERGKCLPDLSKLEELAEILQLSVLELLRCERISEPEEAQQEQIQIYRETLQTEQRQEREKNRRRRRIGLLILSAAVLALLLYRFPIYYALRVWQPSYFETGEIQLLLSRGSPRDLRLARETMELAEEAFSTLQISSAEAEERFGLLARYCSDRDHYPEAVEERHSLALWTAHFPENGDSVDGYSGSAYIWGFYTQKALDQEGKTVCGSMNIPALWRLERSSGGEWVLAGIKEHP